MTTALTNLYVRNLPMEWTSAELIALGEKYGPVVSAKVLYNPLTTASRGMGFIRFAEHADATLAIAGMNGHIPDAVHAKPLNVQFAKLCTLSHTAAAQPQRSCPYCPSSHPLPIVELSASAALPCLDAIHRTSSQRSTQHTYHTARAHNTRRQHPQTSPAPPPTLPPSSRQSTHVARGKPLTRVPVALAVAAVVAVRRSALVHPVTRTVM